MPAVHPLLGCRRCPRAVVALLTGVCSSYACVRCAGWGATASFAHFLASSVSPGAAAPPLLTSLTNCLSRGALLGFYAWVCSLSCVYSCGVCAGCAAGYCAGSSCCLAQCCHGGDLFPTSVVFALVWGFLFVVGVFSRLRLDSLAALVVLPFSSVCLSYAWDVACGGWPCGFSLRASSLVVPCGCVGAL